MNWKRKKSPQGKPQDKGAALLTALIVVAGLSAIAVSALADMRRDQRLSANAQSTAQAQWFAIGAEGYARVMAEDLVSGALPRTALAGPPRTGAFPLDHGMMQVAVSDASTCINANSVVSGAGDIYQRDAAGVAQVIALMEMQGLSSAKSNELADALVGWIDTAGGAVGADDAAYTALAPPYLSGSEPLSEFSELRAIRGFTPDVLAKLRPWLCVLPGVGPSRINLNALTSEQAPVLVAMSGGWSPTLHLTSHKGHRPRWDEERSLHAADTEVEQAIVELVGEQHRSVLDVGTGTGRMLQLLGRQAQCLLHVG